MKRFFLAVLVCFAASVTVANAASGGVLEVGVNRAELINVGGQMSEVIVANPAVADVVVHATNKVSVIGKKIGSTNIRFFDRNGGMLKQVDVIVGYDMPNIRRTLKTYYPDLRLTVDTINNSIAVAGTVPDAQTANRVMQIVYEFVKESRRDDAGGGSGGGQNLTEADNRFPGVVNLLSLNTSQQVMLKVRIGEMQRTALKQLGFNLEALNSGSGGVFQFGSGSGLNLFDPEDGGVLGQFAGSRASENPFAQIGGKFNVGNVGIAGILDLLEQDGLFKLLAEPSLTTVSGETANFLAGGEFPIIIPNEDGANTVEYKKYGVSLSFVPFVLSSNRIRLVVEPELSEIDATLANGTNRAVTTRKAKTTVELAPGEAFMVAGLIRDQVSNSIQELPGVAEVPIISALMRSTAYERRETELVISVTPYIVDPIAANDIRMPTDEYRAPSSMEMFFYGALGSMSGNSYKLSQKPVLEGPIGFMTD